MDHAAAFVEQNGRFAEHLRTADPAAPVPTCPEWTLRQLAKHVGRGDRWATEIVLGGAFVKPQDVAGGKPPEDVAGTVEWLTAGAAGLVAAVERAGPDKQVWTFTGPRPASWWVRRRLHEVVVHHADAALAIGAPWVVDPTVAADGVSEWLGLLAVRPAEEPLLADGTTLHLHATEEGLGAAGEWLVEPGISWTHAHAKATAAVRAPAGDLLLALLRRIPTSALQVHGDPAVLDTWLARTPF